MNSGAPASTAPPDLSSLGMMASHRKSSVAYCAAEKYFGVYAPAGAAAFSFCTIWWTYSAASAGIDCKGGAGGGSGGEGREGGGRCGCLGECSSPREKEGG